MKFFAEEARQFVPPAETDCRQSKRTLDKNGQRSCMNASQTDLVPTLDPPSSGSRAETRVRFEAFH
jgi:hypothetical protein